jgi:hypothetical protein
MLGTDLMTCGLEPMSKKIRKEAVLEEMDQIAPGEALLALIRM